MRTALLLSLPFTLALWGCSAAKDEGKTDEADDTQIQDDTYAGGVDADNDGVTVSDGDCDDNNPDIYAGREEDCDGIDNNCNDVVDEGLSDVDSDGTADCLDVEDCDGVDNDGDGQVDEDFADSDGNGEADCVGTEACDGRDNDGDGQIDEGYDADADGFTQCGSDSEAADCDDGNADANPGEVEQEGDGVDNDCDGIADEGSWAAGDLVITEVMNNPGLVSDAYGEWFEIYNDSPRTLTLNGLTILTSTSNHQITHSSTLTLAPGEFFVMGNSDNGAENGDLGVNYEYSSISLSNESDELSLLAGSVVVDMVMWDDGASMPDPQGASMGLDLGVYSATINDIAAQWCEARIAWGYANGDKGSPGAENEFCSTIDHDADGYTGDEGDCDDGDATVYPGAYEIDPAVDNDCDGVAEEAPNAVADVVGSTHPSCSDITLDGTASSDPQGSSLTYAWTLTSAPASSTRTTADITTTTSSMPTFNPDLPGTYVFELTVNDGGTNSLPDSVTVLVEPRGSNVAPVANAGADQTGSGSANCDPISYGASYDCETCTNSSYSLSASSSGDVDGDTLEYAWSVTSGSTYGSLSASTGESVTLTVAGVSAAYPTAASEVIEVSVTATDCMGASDTDTMTVTYTCTGT